MSEGIGNCTALTKLILYRTNIKTLPESKKITSFSFTTSCLAWTIAEPLWSMSIFVAMPEGIGGLVHLQTLNCQSCDKLESLPNSKIVLFSFIILWLAWTITPHRLLFRFWLFTISEGIGLLVNLQTFNCAECWELAMIPESKITFISFRTLS